jgi:hypothetical protein
MKYLLLILLLLGFAASPAQAHALKRNCLWNGQNIFRLHLMCRDANGQPRATPGRSVRPAPPDKPDCKDDDGKHHDGRGHGKGRHGRH